MNTDLKRTKKLTRQIISLNYNQYILNFLILNKNYFEVSQETDNSIAAQP